MGKSYDYKKLHTFAVCAYKNSPYLEDCIKSLLSQSEKSNVIVCCDPKNFYVKQIAEKYSLPLFLKNHISIGEDWNFAYECADTKYVTIAHQDDIYFFDFCKKTIDTMEDDKSFLCVTDYVPINEYGNVVKDINHVIRKALKTPLVTSFFKRNKLIRRASLSFGNSFCCPTVTYNKEIMGKNIFKSDFSYCIDWDCFLTFCKKDGAISYIPKKLLGYRLSNQSTSSEWIKNGQRYTEDSAMFEKIWGRFFAKVIMAVYKNSYKNYSLSNRSKECKNKVKILTMQNQAGL